MIQALEIGRRTTPRVAGAVILALAVAGCSPAPSVSCAAGLGVPNLVFTLFFGRSVHRRTDVSEAEWQEFQSSTLTPSLPNGYTAVDATGAWMNPASGVTVHEATKVLIVALPDSAASLAAINRVRAAYQARFHQQLVGMTAEHACAAF